MHKGGTYLHRRPAVLDKGRIHDLQEVGSGRHRHDKYPEAKLAREAEICYETVALSTDYDCWHSTEEPVTVEMILGTLRKNVSVAKDIIRNAAPMVSPCEGVQMRYCS